MLFGGIAAMLLCCVAAMLLCGIAVMLFCGIAVMFALLHISHLASYADHVIDN